MANCMICNTSVGCGCNLKDGMCTYCYNKNKEALIIKPIIDEND